MLNLKRGIGTHEPSVISLGQVWVDIMLNVDKVPAQADSPWPIIRSLHWRQLSRAAGGQPHGRADRARRHSGQRPVGAFHPPVIPRQRHYAYRPGSS